MGWSEDKCKICASACVADHEQLVDHYDCPRCGKYQDEVGSGYWKPESPDQVARLAGWVREQNEAGITPAITRDVALRVFAMTLPRLQVRATKALTIVARKYGQLDTLYTDLESDLEIAGASYSVDSKEVDVLLRILADDGLLNYRGGSGSLTVRGVLAVEEASRSGSNSAQGCVAMDFAIGMNDAWTNGFDPGIRAAGFRPRRIDSKDYVGGITDEIMAEIRVSRFVVTDYTGQKAGVYFEAGFALGLGLTVIPTCRTDEIEKLHFDVKHLNTLAWKTPADLSDRLAKRIRAVIGGGPDLLVSEGLSK